MIIIECFSDFWLNCISAYLDRASIRKAKNGEKVPMLADERLLAQKKKTHFMGEIRETQVIDLFYILFLENPSDGDACKCRPWRTEKNIRVNYSSRQGLL